MLRTDLLVVGGGAMGSATAWWAARAGRDIVLLERHAGHHDRGSSHGRARIFRLAYQDPYYVDLAREAYGLWRSLESSTGASLLTTTGGLDHGTAAAQVAANLDAARVPYSTLPTDEAAERWPGLRFDGPVVYQPDAGRLDADATVRTLYAASVAAGADVRFSVTVRGARESPYGVVVETDGEPVEARVVVVAAGGWLPGLLDALPVLRDLPAFRVTQEQPVFFAARVSGEEWPSFIHWRGDRVPYYGLGSPGDGVKVGEHGSGRVVSPDARLPVDLASVARVEAYAESWLPGVEPVATRVDGCLYTSTPDETFVLKRYGPVVVCSPCSGHGFKFVPVIGKLTAELASG